jgi:hypothetical protein
LNTALARLNFVKKQAIGRVAMGTSINDLSIRKATRFDSAKFVKSVIARPLLDQIEHEVKVTEEVITKYPTIRKKYNTAVFLNPEFAGGLGAALLAVKAMLLDADQEVSPSKKSKIDKPIVKIGQDVAPAWLERSVIRELMGINVEKGSPIASVWPTLFEVIININPESVTSNKAT